MGAERESYTTDAPPWGFIVLRGRRKGGEVLCMMVDLEGGTGAEVFCALNSVTRKSLVCIV